MLFHRFLDLLVSPESHEPLAYDEGEECLRAPDGRTYSVRNGVPILLTSEDRAEFERILSHEGKAMVEEYGQDQASAAEAAYYPPTIVPYEIVDAIYDRKGDATRILSVGGGPTRNSPKEINLNLGLFPDVDLVGNAMRLPFRTGSVDGIWCNAVLEHVADASSAVREMVRVLEPGGSVIVLVPFLQPMHAYPQDFNRYTAEGLAYLMRDLKIVAKGQSVGPSWTVLEIITRYLDGPGMTAIPRWVRGLTRRTLIPALRRSVQKKNDWTGRPEDEVMPSLVYCIGRKA
ncbi:methyltransferase domain-containing protein [bacterium]|nr:methyltransferase domain-containing protein [bacterium]